MALRFLFRSSQVGCLHKPITSNRLSGKLIIRKGNITNLQEKHKHKICNIPYKLNSIKKYSCFKQSKNLKWKFAEHETDGKDYYEKIDEINYGPYFSKKYNSCKFKKLCPRTRTTLGGIFKFCSQENIFHEMESYFFEMKHIDDDINTSWTIKSSEIFANRTQNIIQQILHDIDLKIQNDIWNQSGPEIVNNLNSKNEVWKLIDRNRNGFKQGIFKNFSTANLWKKFMQPPEHIAEETKPLKWPK